MNDDLGGVAGHPIKLVDCFVATTEQQGQACAQQFLAQKVKVVVEGTALLGAQALHSALNGAIPVVVSDPANLADATAKNSYSLTAGGFATIPSFVSGASALKAKTASLLFPSDDPTGLALAGQFNKAAGAAGLTLTKAGYTTSSPDILPSVIAAKSSSTDVTMTFFAVPPACIAGAKAFQQENVTKPIIALGTCLATPVKEALGDYPKWLYANLVENPAAPSPDSAVQGYLQVMRHYAGRTPTRGAPGRRLAGRARRRASDEPRRWCRCLDIRDLEPAQDVHRTDADGGANGQVRIGPRPADAAERSGASVPVPRQWLLDHRRRWQMARCPVRTTPATRISVIQSPADNHDADGGATPCLISFCSRCSAWALGR